MTSKRRPLSVLEARRRREGERMRRFDAPPSPSPLTCSCAFCGWRFSGEPRLAIAAAAVHRQEHHRA